MSNYYIATAGDFSEIPDGWYGVAKDGKLIAMFNTIERAKEYIKNA
jgi:hypothetical protein